MIDKDAGVAAAAARSLGLAGLRKPLELPEGTSLSSSLPEADPTAEKVENGTQKIPNGDASEPPGTALRWQELPLNEVVDESQPVPSSAGNRLAIIAELSGMASGRDPKAAIRAAAAIGHIAAGETSLVALDAVFQALIKLSAKKGDELHFAVGEALCFAYGGTTGCQPHTKYRLLRATLKSKSLSWQHLPEF